ncbi:unnamed protein product [Gongylonema pulchrum]|uniref:TFIIS N-terminal domain-containing protein n=1 Tax=Gongylonema pulchrum TaxID=637853 RepID=A0A183DN52_9BILA|nr:unnamed protein product [Gongylonema pulchrum]
MQVSINYADFRLIRSLLCFQMTRIGATVNDFRKKVAQSAPALAKQCRALIKCWQKLADPKPTSSGSSSANGTPSCASSPAVKKGAVTPGTPAVQSAKVTPVANARLATPAGSSRLTPLASSSSRLTTPVASTGARSSPATLPNGLSGELLQQQQRKGPSEVAVADTKHTGMRKCSTIPTDMASKALDGLPSSNVVRNGKRKAGNSADTGQWTAPAVKRPHVSSAMTSPAAHQSSLLAARRANVKSTSELVAQLTENLPGNLAIDLSKAQDSAKKQQQHTERSNSALAKSTV